MTIKMVDPFMYVVCDVLWHILIYIEITNAIISIEFFLSFCFFYNLFVELFIYYFSGLLIC